MKIPKLASPGQVLMAAVHASEFKDFAGNH